MNSSEAQTDLERMVLRSFITRLMDLGANELQIDNALEPLDFDDIRQCLPLTDEEVRKKFANLF